MAKLMGMKPASIISTTLTQAKRIGRHADLPTGIILSTATTKAKPKYLPFRDQALNSK